MSERTAARGREAGGLASPGAVITVGTFDGVHRGHWAVLERLRSAAQRLGRRSMLVTFDPHPLRIVRPEAAPRLLTTPLEKKEILAESGVEYAVFLSFTPQLARTPPREFVEEILLQRLGLRHLVVGYDHGLGRGRSGDVEMLRTLGHELGFTLEVVPAVMLSGAPISSTRIRRALEAGDVEAAARALGRPYSLRGPVVRGEGRGRALGFPTANIDVADPDKLLPREGVYAVRAVLRQAAAGAGRGLGGVLHLGPRPTFRGSPPSIELHLFDFDQDIYGEAVRIDFCARLRDIHHFQSTAELVRAIQADCAAARALFAPAGSLP
ncbi:MAG: bifunctional riboflavin kinase/FAD synthetase [Gemmatimonadetes bacterium]|nr:bifunctional riboflavin kinase/FAD synthetase [Gemmatimonadota bacterium]